MIWIQAGTCYNRSIYLLNLSIAWCSISPQFCSTTGGCKTLCILDRMAYTQAISPPTIHQPYHDAGSPSMQRRQASKQRFVAELSQCLFDFVIQLLPTQEEMAVKEDVRKLLERLIRTIEPDSRLLSFGSTANGFSLRNSGLWPSHPASRALIANDGPKTWICAVLSTQRSGCLPQIS